MTKVIGLVPRDESRTKSVAEFLRDLADKMDVGEESAHGAIVVIYERVGDEFRTATRKVNLDFLQEIGLLTTAIYDVQNVSQKDD